MLHHGVIAGAAGPVAHDDVPDLLQSSHAALELKTGHIWSPFALPKTYRIVGAKDGERQHQEQQSCGDHGDALATELSMRGRHVLVVNVVVNKGFPLERGS